MNKISALISLGAALLLGAVASADETPQTVIGPSNINLYDGAAALIAGDAEKGVRLTQLGLSMATSRRERLIGLSNLCAGYVLLEQYDNALSYCNQALELNDRHWRSYSNRALIYLKLKRYSEAELDLERGLAISPNATELRTVKSQLLDEVDPVSPKITIDDRRGKNDQ